MNIPEWSSLPGRFWSKVDESGPIPEHRPELGNCWTWTAGLFKSSGYGQFYYEGAGRAAHRISLQDSLGDDLDGLVSDHMCHNPSCVRPSHLRPLTIRENLHNRRGADSHNKCGVRGVHWSERDRRWIAKASPRGRQMEVGRFRTLQEAESAIVAFRREHMPSSLMDQSPAL